MLKWIYKLYTIGEVRMKKSAYTLAEVLIAVGIVGIIAAIMLPLATKFKPDKNKVLFLKTYDDIVKTTSILTKNGDIYPLTDGEYSYANSPLKNTSAVTYNGIEIAGGDSKYCAALALGMNATSNTCSDADANNRGFVLSNGVSVKVNGLKIIIDIDGDKGKNCSYSEECKKPDEFKLEVAPNGAVAITDSAGVFYRRTRSNWKMRDIIPYTEEEIAKWNDDPKKLVDYKEPEKEEIEVPDEPATPAPDDQSSAATSSSAGGGNEGGDPPEQGPKDCEQYNSSSPYVNPDATSIGCIPHCDYRDGCYYTNP